MEAGLIPVKSFARAKLRLAPLGAQERERLARALFADALELARSAPFLEWHFLSDSPEVLSHVRAEGFGAISDRGTGLNEALGAAFAELSASGATSVTILPSDVPLAYEGDVRDIVDTGATSDVVVVPANDGGTNALYMSPPAAIAPAFGEGSLRRHLARAEEAGLRCTLLPIERMALDLDEVEDLKTFLGARRFARSRTEEVVSAWAASGLV